jgi:hypothetical protein
MAQLSLEPGTETAGHPRNPPVYQVAKALTIHQPESWLVACGYQRVANRSWDTDYRGLVAIHAGVHRNHSPEETIELMTALGHEPINYALQSKQHKANELLHYGCVIGVVELLDCLLYDQIEALDQMQPPQPGQLPLEAFAEGPICWRFGQAVLLPKPVKRRGNLRLWTLDDATAAKVASQLRLGPASRSPAPLLSS